MTLAYSDAWLDIHAGDCREVLPTLPDASVDCVVTSPPYWGLRDYGTATWIGGDEGCDHIAIRRPGPDDKSFTNGGTSRDKPRSDCRKCGAVRQDAQLGLEPTPEQYVANLVAVFREVRRVLKPSGTVWLNLGDSYSSGTGGDRSIAGDGRADPGKGRARVAVVGMKPKDLVGIPWRVAFALQADGWYLRSDIVWSKPNPMPESVTDRPTKAHEYVFLLTKSATYFFDQDAVREPAIYEGTVVKASNPDTAKNGQKGKHGATAFGFTQHDTVVGAGRNLRSVWTIATRPYPGAHFAVFPPELPERCIKAGSSEHGVCPECGAPWERVVERDEPAKGPRDYPSLVGRHQPGSTIQQGGQLKPRTSVTTGWHPACYNNCPVDWGGADPVPAVILDPFAGSGTVGMVANRLSRRAILIDLNADYITQQMRRNAQTPLGLGGAAL
jgi:DNA modification methylase